MRFVYPIDIAYHAGDGEFLVTFPDLPEAITSGEDRPGALIQAVDCLEEAIAARIKAREDLPPPSAARGRPCVAPGSLIGAKAALYLAMKEADVRPAELARRMGSDRGAVNRLLDPAHASKSAQFDAAFAALGKRLVVSVESAA